MVDIYERGLDRSLTSPEADASCVRYGPMAEREGFEPSVPLGTHDFQSCTFNHSVTAPGDSSATRNPDIHTTVASFRTWRSSQPFVASVPLAPTKHFTDICVWFEEIEA